MAGFASNSKNFAATYDVSELNSTFRTWEEPSMYFSTHPWKQSAISFLAQNTIAVCVAEFEADECSNVQSRLGSNDKCHCLQFAPAHVTCTTLTTDT